MSEDLTPRQQILLWDLLARGGSAPQKDLKPDVKPADRDPLLKAKLISVAKPNNGASVLTLEEAGRTHLASVPPSLLKTGDGSKYDRPILQFVLARLHAYATATTTSYADIFAARSADSDTTPTTRPEPTLLPIETIIRSAFFDIAGRPARDAVRLRALREHLPTIDRATLDAALLKMRKSGRANLTSLDNPDDIEAEGDAGLKAGGQTFHLLWIDP